MLFAVFSKEFYKIRWMWCILLVLNIGVSANVWMSTRRLFILDHPEVVWYRVIHLGQMYFENFRFLPLFSGILIACFQFLPEMWEERLKLSLHLPISAPRLIFYHLAVGFVSLVLVLVPMLGFLLWTTIYYFPLQMLTTALLTCTPWFFAGIAAYLGGALVLMEPNLRLKAANGLVSAAVTGLYLFRAEPGAYAHHLPLLFLPLVLMALSVLYPAFRFRYRRAA